MGHIFSSEEKLSRHRREEIHGGKNSRKIVGLYEQYGYHSAHNSFERPYEPRYKKRRNVSFHGRYGRSEYYRTKSHSLNAILEELYSLGPEDTFEEGRRKINYETGGSLIPRVKLKRSTSSLNEERSYKTLCKMSSESEIFIRGNSNSSPNILINENNDVKLPKTNISILLNDETYDEISPKSDENYFTKNFDDCMKRLQLIEKEHELIEKEDGDLQFCILQKDKENSSETETETDKTEETCDYEIQCDFKNLQNELGETKLSDGEVKSENERSDKIENKENCLTRNSIPAETVEKTEHEGKENEEPTITSWYSNLKQQFEKKEQENQDQKTKEISCRITGATLKNRNEKTKSEEDKEKDTRHYFSRLVKTNKSLLDEELPDPDKVKHIRAMFQENLNSTLKRRLDKKLGGSLQNISVRTAEQQMNRPMSAQCYRNDLFCETSVNQKSEEEKNKTTDLPRRDGEVLIENTKKKLFEKYEKDLKPGRDHRNRRVLQPKWTDTGSVSSGISSDLSSYDTDLECYSREGTEQDEIIISDDDLLEEIKDKHYVQNEVLEKIRSFGTSVTYYGGEMITCSVGPLLSPTTQAIIEEIGEKYGKDSSPARSFDEFYRKYVETNEHSRKKKLGRTRSFGQNDVFQKPNVLSNTEIEMYKNDLEIEIGIKKPAGIQQNSLKRKVTKSPSLECNVDNPKEKHSEPPIQSENLNYSNKTNICGAENDVTERTNNAVQIPKTSCHSGDDSKNHTDNLEKKETEYKTETNEEEESQQQHQQQQQPQKTTVEKGSLFSRSKSVPEGFPIGQTTKSDYKPVEVEHPAKEIFFSYEKSIFNGKRNSDMEFEEFEVCESLSEKLEKLEKNNSHENSSDSQEILSTENTDAKLEKSCEINGELDASTTPEGNSGKENEIDEVEQINSEIQFAEEHENATSDKKDSKVNHSRWPIETTVMVDIQKNNEQTPKLITSGKTVAKTKIRLF